MPTSMNKSLNILHIVTELTPEQGGLYTAVVDLAGALAAAPAQPGQPSLTVTVASMGRADPPESWQHAPPAAAVPAVEAQALDRMEAICAGHDVVHAHGVWGAVLTRTAQAARATQTPMIVSPHGMLDDWSMAQKAWKKKLFLTVSGRRAIRQAYAMHFTAQAERDQATQYVQPPRSEVLPLVFDVEPYRDLPDRGEAREVWGLSDDEPAVMFLSRLHPKKGLETLIESMQTVSEQTGAVLLIAGSGEAAYQAELSRRIDELGLHEHVKFLGPVRGGRKTALFRAAEVFAIPTQQENFGLVFPEAMACGTSVITTRGVDIWQELEANGARIVDRTAAAFADAIVQALTLREDSAARGERGRAWVMQTLAPTQVIGGYDALYRQAAQGSS